MNMKVILVVMDRNKSFFWSLAKTGKKIKCINVPWFMSYRVKHSKRNSISTRSIYLDRSSNTVQGFWFIRVYPTRSWSLPTTTRRAHRL